VGRVAAIAFMEFLSGPDERIRESVGRAARRGRSEQ
jgi:hypothetical protein